MTLENIRKFFDIGVNERQWKAATYYNRHKHLKRFLGWCIKEGHLNGENPLDAIKKPKKDKPLPRRLTEEQGQKIIHTTLSMPWRYHFEAERNYAMIGVLLYTGIRSRELLGLRVSDVNIRAGKIFIEKGKGGKDRYVPIHRKLDRILLRFLEARSSLGKQSAYLFTAVQSETPLGYKNLNKICQRISKAVGFKFTPHQLRHTFASACVDQNMNLPQLQQILGHGSIHSTMIYLHVSTKATAEAMEKIDLF